MSFPILTFGFSAPMGSWGTATVTKARDTASWPQKSAILGMCAAALGVRRDDGDGLAQLESLYLATASKTGQRWQDYQTISARRSHGPMTRFEARNDLAGTVVTDNKVTRDYLSDIEARIALWAHGPEGVSLLERLSAAILRPRFALYVGRRSCPLTGLRPPALVAAETPRAALEETYPEVASSGWMYHGDIDPRLGGEAAIQSQDQPNRARGRHFSTRPVEVFPLGETWSIFEFEDILR